MNAGPIEHFERWDIHKEGTQTAIRRVIDALDAERIAVREGFGYRSPHFPLAHHYASEGEPWMYGRGSHDRLTDSGDWRERIVLSEHRYMREDLRLGLSFQVSVAELAGVAAAAAPFGYRHPCRRQLLDAMVEAVSNIDVAVAVDHHRAGVVELARARAV